MRIDARLHMLSAFRETLCKASPEKYSGVYHGAPVREYQETD